ncbi:MAG: dUTP diphosphatase [Bacteroidales bacterium]|nr:dUTP diphosphatase [Bacteroidales bacterium]
MEEIKDIIDEIVRFRNERDWEQFHDTKNLAIALAIEAAELNELFLWKTIEESEQVDKEKVKDELADILVYALLIAHRQGFDVKETIMNKMAKNADKYPVNKAKGNAKKYNDL